MDADRLKTRADCLAVLWVLVVALAACGEETPTPSGDEAPGGEQTPGGEQSPDSCEPAVQEPVRRLSAFEYTRALDELVGVQVDESTLPATSVETTFATEEEQLSDSPVLVENAYQIKAEAFDSEHVYAVDEDVVIHDFDDEHLVSEIVVNFDELVDPAEQTVRFNPELLSEGEPELMPAKALPIDDGGDANIAGHSIAAFEALGDGRWKDAADDFRLVCNSLPGDSTALNNFGLSLLQLAIQVHEGNPTPTPAEEPHFEAAVLALRQAAQQDKYNPIILYNLATCLATCERHGVAIRIWDATISLAPDDAAPLNGKAVSMIALNEFDTASTLLMRARELSPSEPVILRNLRRLRPTI